MIGPFCGFRNGIRSFLRRQVRLGLDLALEGVACLDHDTVAGLDLQHRLGVRPHGVVIAALLGLRQLVRRACLRLGHAARSCMIDVFSQLLM